MSMDMKSKTMENALKLAGECFAPGASLLMDGKILEGSAHLILGLWSKAALGPVAMGLVIANSYSSSVSGKSLLKHFVSADRRSPDAEDAPAAKSDDDEAAK